MTKIQYSEVSVPLIPKDLLDFLKRAFPDQAPGLTMSQREADAQFGRIDLIRTLEAHYNRQNTTVLNKS